MAAPNLMHDQPAGDTSVLSDQIVFRAQDNNDSTYYNGTTPFCEFRRGLSQFGNAIAAGLYGNNTDLTPSVQVVVGRSLPIIGEWFTPGNVIFQWDGTIFDTAVTDGSGHFSKTITVPATTVGAHTIRMSNAGTDFLVTVIVVPSLVSSDDYNNLWHSDDFTITLTCADNGKGIAATYYKLNNGPIKSVSVDGQPRITTEGANNILEYWSVDGAGNEEYSHKMLTEIKLDKTAPTGSIQINNGANYTCSSNVTLTLTAADPASGVFQIRFSNDGVWDTEQWEAPASTKNWILTSGDGSKTVYYQIKDNAGSITSYNSSVTLDETKPVVNAGQNRVVSLGSNVTLDASECTDNLGIVSYEWNFGDGTTGTGKTATHTYSSSGAYTVTLIAQDAAGNTDTSTTTITVEAAVIPEIPSFMVLLSFFFASLLVSVAYKRRPMKTKRK
jgi:PKD repeat protein